jgi:hypothetical protein
MRGRARHIEPERARGRRSEGVYVLHGVGDVAQGGAQAGEQPFAGFRGSDAAGGAVQQTDAQPLLDATDGVAEGRRRHAQLHGGAPEAAVGRDRDEGREIGEIGALH